MTHSSRSDVTLLVKTGDGIDNVGKRKDLYKMHVKK